MARIAVFDSGLGSLSIIKAVQKKCKAEIIYFADRENFPYGKKSSNQLKQIIKKSIKTLETEFNPDLIVIGSNTPTIMFDLTTEYILGVNPPIKEAAKKTKSKNIGILATEALVKSDQLTKYIKNSKISNDIKIHKINASNLVQLVESGKFLENKTYCKNVVKKSLESIILKNNIDTLTLSSTHLPFLESILKSVFPNIRFIDPADRIAEKICKVTQKKSSNRNLLKIYSSDKTGELEKNLRSINIDNQINYLSI